MKSELWNYYIFGLELSHKDLCKRIGSLIINFNLINNDNGYKARIGNLLGPVFHFYTLYISVTPIIRKPNVFHMKRKMDHISCFKERTRFSVLDKVNCTVARIQDYFTFFYSILKRRHYFHYCCKMKENVVCVVYCKFVAEYSAGTYIKKS